MPSKNRSLWVSPLNSIKVHRLTIFVEKGIVLGRIELLLCQS